MGATRWERFWSRVDVNGPNGCWLWGGKMGAGGYGSVYVGTSRKDHRQMKAHRYAYIALEGPVPDGLDLDHLCRVRHCVNPDHLEPVTRSENVRRGLAPAVNSARGRALTHCKRGHLLDYVSPDGRRGCLTCRREATAASSERRKGVAA